MKKVLLVTASLIALGAAAPAVAADLAARPYTKAPAMIAASPRLSAVAAVDAAAGWILGGSIDAGELQRCARDPCRVTVLAPQKRGTPACRLVELGSSGKSPIPPCVVVPAGADYPGVGQQAFRPLLDSCQRLVEAPHSGEVERQVAIGEPLEVDMRIDQAWPRPAAQPDHTTSPAGRRTRGFPHRQDPSVDAGRDLGHASREQRRLDHRP